MMVPVLDKQIVVVETSILAVSWEFSKRMYVLLDIVQDWEFV